MIWRFLILVAVFVYAFTAEAESAFGKRGGIHIGVADGRYVNDDIYDGVTLDNATNTGRSSPFFISHTTSLAPGVGIGTCEDFIAETAAGNNEIGVQVCAVTTDVTGGSEDFDHVVYAMAAGATATEVARFASTGAATITGTCTVQGATLTLGNNANGTLTLTFDEDTANGSITYDGVTFAFNDDLSITGTLAVTSTSDLQGDVSDSLGVFTIADAATVTGALTASSTLAVTSTSDLQGDVSDTLGVFTIADAATITGALSASSTLAVTGTSDLQGDVSDTLGVFTIADSATVTGALSASSTLAVVGTSDLQGDISDSLGVCTVADAFAVTGTSDLQGDVSDSLGVFTIADAATITGALIASSTLAVTGTSDLQGDVSDTLGVFTVADAMAVTGTSDLQGDVSDSLGVFTIADAATITGAFTASSTSALNGNATMGNDALFLVDVNTGLTALAGGGQGGAGALTAQHNEVATVATAADSVTLPAAAAGLRIYVANDAAANSMNVFPALGDNFVGLAANTAVAVIAGTAREWVAIDATEWVPSSVGRTMLRQLTPLHVLQAVGNDPAVLDAERMRFQPVVDASRQGIDFTGAAGGIIGSLTASSATGELRLSSSNTYFWCMYGGTASVFCTGGAAATAPHLQMQEDKLIGYATDATITALAGGGQGGAGALTDEINEVSVVASGGDSVTLPAAAAGLRIVVVNNGASSANVFPASGDNLGAGVNTAVALPAGTGIEYFAYDATNWESFISGVAASNIELNTLDGVAATLTATELNTLDGVAATLTATELNTLDGVAATLTATELNILDGVTSTAAEINLLDASTAATLTATQQGIMYTAVARYDFATNGGTIGTIAIGSAVPDNAIILGGFVEVETTLTSATDAATIALSIVSGNDVKAAIAISDVTNPWDAPDRKSIIPKFNTPETTSLKLTAANQIDVVIGAENVTAGRFWVTLFYMMGFV